jgi:hypothetical protein
MELTTIVIRWDGPYSIDDVHHFNPSNKINGNGLYLMNGRGPREKTD